MDREGAVMRSTPTSDEAGGWTEVWDQVDIVPVRVSPVGSGETEQLVASRLTERTPYSLYFPVGTDIRSADRVYIGDELFEIHGVTDGTSDQVTVQAVASKERP